MHNASDPLHGDIRRLAEIMARLRDPVSGCPWDVAQDFRSIAPYTIEEAYEVAEACERDDMSALKDELGDLLLQVVFHARMAEERGVFGLSDVVDAICDKMIRRHPHVFGPEGAVADWEGIKEAERAEKQADGSAIAGVALSLPALLRAEKLQKRAARVGFDWPDHGGAHAKVNEELAELQQARTQDEREDELGDLLFSVVNLGRKLGVEPEAALRRANKKFEKRFRLAERMGGTGFSRLALEEMESLWQAAKRAQAADRD